MAVEVRLFPALQDNYGFLVRDVATGVTAAVDTPYADAVLAASQQAGWEVSMILNTHWHVDHTQGNAAVKAVTGAEIVGPEEVRRAAPLDRAIAPGDHVMLGETRFEVIETGGHTLGHVSLHAPDAATVFTGDALFSMGCGRMFEGTPEQMWAGLERLAALPDETVVWSAHEYTEANARFALSIDGDSAVRARADQVFAARGRGEPTTPSTIGLEKATNPMLRASRLHPGLAPAQAFAAVRKGKDDFKG